MKRVLIGLIIAGLTGSLLNGCGTKSKMESSENVDSHITSNSSEEEVKEDSKTEEESENTHNENDKTEEEENKDDTEDNNIEEKEDVIVEDGFIKIPESLKLAEVELNYNDGDPLKVKEINSYNKAIENDMLYGVIIGEKPLTNGDIDGTWEYNTLITKFNTVKYPNFFELQKSEMPNLEFGITLKSKDRKIEFSAGSNGNYDGKTLEDELEILTKNKEQNGYKIILKKQEGNTYTLMSEKDGFIEYEYGVMEVPGADIPVFMYRYPEKYKELFSKIIEESKDNFYITRNFPKEYNENSNEDNTGNEEDGLSSDIDINKYKLTPEDANKLFYKKKQENVEMQNEIEKFLNDTYGDVGMVTLLENIESVENKFGYEFLYMEKPKEEMLPIAFVGEEPIYMFNAYYQLNIAFYLDSKGEVYSRHFLLDAFNSGNLYRILEGKKIQVLIEPSFDNNEFLVSFDNNK